jgi:DHA1 family multidrug resistance protein-like MFS transporter
LTASPVKGAEAKPRMPSEARLLFIGLFLSVASNNLFTPLLPAIRLSMGESTKTIGAFVAAYGLARLIVDLPSGALTARLGPRRTVTIGVALNAGSCVVGLLAPNFSVLLASRVGSGIGAGLLATVVLSALSDIAPAAIRGRVMSLYQVANNLGIAVYPLAGGLVGTAFGWRAAFVVAIVLSTASGLTLAPLLGTLAVRARTAETERARPREADGTPKTASKRAVPVMAFVAIYAGVFANMTNRHGFRNTVLPLFAAGNLHLNEVQAATGVTLMSLVGIAITIPGAALGDIIGRRRIVVAGLSMLAIGDLIFPELATSYPLFILAAMLVGTGDFFSSSQTAMLSDLVDGPRRALVLGAYRFFVDLGALVGPSCLGYVYGAYGVGAAMRVAAGVLIFTAVLNFVFIPRAGRSAEA